MRLKVSNHTTRCGQVNSVSILIHLFTTADFSSLWVEYNSISACTSYYRIPYLYQSTYFQVSYLWISILTPQLQLIFLFCLLNGINHPYLETISITRRRHLHIQISTANSYVPRHSRVQSSAIITRSNWSRSYIRHCNNSGRKWIRYQNHKSHLISRLHGWAMGCLLWGFVKKIDHVITALHYM